tara:strand:+ start:1727 stop:1978 length:252 start_codon:yes stop_codon:yes gene_type:complete
MSWKNIIKNDMEQYERRMLREEKHGSAETDPEWTKLAEEIHDDYIFASHKLGSIMDYVQKLMNDDDFAKSDLEHILELATKKK